MFPFYRRNKRKRSISQRSMRRFPAAKNRQALRFRMNDKDNNYKNNGDNNSTNSEMFLL